MNLPRIETLDLRPYRPVETVAVVSAPTRFGGFRTVEMWTDWDSIYPPPYAKAGMTMQAFAEALNKLGRAFFLLEYGRYLEGAPRRRRRPLRKWAWFRIMFWTGAFLGMMEVALAVAWWLWL